MAKLIKRSLLGLFAWAALLGPTTAPASAQASTPPAFSWGGLQFGVYAGSITGSWLLETRVGYNFVRDRLVLGVDLGAGALVMLGVVEARGRVGALVRPNLHAYYSTGVTIVQSGGPYLTLGVGIEYGLSNDLSVIGEVNVIHPFFVSPSPYVPTVLVGLSWRPGR